MCLPVWRELKLTVHLVTQLTFFEHVHMCLPVWRELKRLRSIVPVIRARGVHMCLPVWRELKRPDTPRYYPRKHQGSHVPSRLEGIETFRFPTNPENPTGSHVPSRLEGIETDPGLSSS